MLIYPWWRGLKSCRNASAEWETSIRPCRSLDFQMRSIFSLPSSTRQIAAESFTLTLIGLESSQALKRKCNWITPSSGGGGNGTHLKINLAIDFIKIRWVEVFWAVLLGNLGSQMTFLPKNKIPTTVLFRVLDGLLLPKYFPVIKTKSFLIRIIELFFKRLHKASFFFQFPSLSLLHCEIRKFHLLHLHWREKEKIATFFA